MFWVQETAAHVWLWSQLLWMWYYICKGFKENRQSYNMTSEIHITYCSVWDFFFLRRSGNSCCLRIDCIYFLRFLCHYIFHIVAFIYGVFSITWFEYCRFFQNSLLILLCWSFYARFLKLVICVNVFCACFLRILIRGSNSSVIFCFSLLLTFIHFALVHVTLYWLCVLIHIFF